METVTISKQEYKKLKNLEEIDMGFLSELVQGVVLYMSCFFEIVMTDEILDGSDVVCRLLGEGERFSDQTRYPLSQRAVESLDVIGDT